MRVVEDALGRQVRAVVDGRAVEVVGGRAQRTQALKAIECVDAFAVVAVGVEAVVALSLAELALVAVVARAGVVRAALVRHTRPVLAEVVGARVPHNLAELARGP